MSLFLDGFFLLKLHAHIPVTILIAQSTPTNKATQDS